MAIPIYVFTLENLGATAKLRPRALHRRRRRAATAVAVWSSIRLLKAFYFDFSSYDINGFPRTILTLKKHI